jgi:hypothetical protein
MRVLLSYRVCIKGIVFWISLFAENVQQHDHRSCISNTVLTGRDFLQIYSLVRYFMYDWTYRSRIQNYTFLSHSKKKAATFFPLLPQVPTDPLQGFQRINQVRQMEQRDWYFWLEGGRNFARNSRYQHCGSHSCVNKKKWHIGYY